MSKLGIAWAWIKGVFSFGSSGAESVIDYVLASLNDMLNNSSMVDIRWKVIGIHKYAQTARGILSKYRGWCPNKWLDEYDSLVSTVIMIDEITEDGKVTVEELYSAINCFKTAYAQWMED